jgi:hypothetical protein
MAACKLWEELVVVLGAHILANPNLSVWGCARITRAHGWPKHRLNPPSLTSPLLAPFVEGAILALATTNDPQRDVCRSYVALLKLLSPFSSLSQ